MRFPDMGDAFTEWSDATTFMLIDKTILDHKTIETKKPVEFDMLLVPMKAQQVDRKPEGQRAWRWWTGVSEYELGIADEVVDEDKVRYRVQGKGNYKIAGFYAYELIEAFK